MSRRPVAFLDRDGVLNEFAVDPRSGLLDSPFTVEDVHLVPGAAAAAARLARAGFALVCVTNQPAAAHGKASIAKLLEVHRRVEQLLVEQGATLDASRLCWHHPEGKVPSLTGRCDCRKPAPGMLLDAARAIGVDLDASWMVGDSDTDIAAGQAVGCRTLLIECLDTAHKRASDSRPDLRASDLAEGVDRLLEIADRGEGPRRPGAARRNGRLRREGARSRWEGARSR